MRKSQPNNIDEIVKKEIDSRIKIPLKYWYPTIIAVIAFTASGVWWFYQQLAPLEQRLSKLEQTRQTPDRDRMFPVRKIKHIQGISPDGTLDETQEKILSDMVYELTNERKDLVLIVTGYTEPDDSLDKEKKILESDKIAQKIRNVLIFKGIAGTRVFAKGYGTDVPDFFKTNKHLNVALMQCDVLILMKYFAIE